METLDLKKMYQSLYMPAARKIEAVEVPELQFIMIDGAIEPGQAPGTSSLFEEIRKRSMERHTRSNSWSNSAK